MGKYIIVFTKEDNGPLEVYNRIFRNKSDALEMAECISSNEVEFLNSNSKEKIFSRGYYTSEFDIATIRLDEDGFKIVTGYSIFKGDY